MDLMKVTIRAGLTPIETNRVGLELKGTGSACGRTANVAPHPLAAAAEWAIGKTRRAMTAFNREPTSENKHSARAWAKRLDYELAKRTD
jgi:hypothetical protein